MSAAITLCVVAFAVLLNLSRAQSSASSPIRKKPLSPEQQWRFAASTTNVQARGGHIHRGEYNSLPLTPGRYTVTVQQPGFRERTIEVNLGVSQRVQMDFSLELGTSTRR